MRNSEPAESILFTRYLNASCDAYWMKENEKVSEDEFNRIMTMLDSPDIENVQLGETLIDTILNE